MKNIGKSILTSAIMMIFAIQVQSQNTTTQAKPAVQEPTAATTAPGTFIDKNNNGVCDNFEARQGKGRGGNFVDKDNDGICDNFVSRQANGRGTNFVDKNGDGICDNRANVGKKAGNRNGQGNQYRNGQGCGQGRCGRR